MPSLKAVRVRIASVKSTQKITRAMKLVAAAKLRRGPGRHHRRPPLRQRPGRGHRRAGGARGRQRPPHAPAAARAAALAGHSTSTAACAAASTPTGAARPALRHERSSAQERRGPLDVGGARGARTLRAAQAEIPRVPGVSGDTCHARPELALTRDDDSSRPVDGVYLVYNEFKSAISQRVDRALCPSPRAPPWRRGPDDFSTEPQGGAAQHSCPSTSRARSSGPCWSPSPPSSGRV
jgi:F-type H+-transporting ATPase subunit gamma